MASVNRSTASSCASRSASSRWAANASGRVTSRWTDESWSTHGTSGTGTALTAR